VDTTDEKQQIVAEQIATEKLHATIITDLPRFDPNMPLSEAFAMGREAFEEAQEENDVPHDDYDLTLSMMQGLLAQQTPPNWSLGFATGFVHAFLQAHRLA
jgi:hypothetical protein